MGYAEAIEEQMRQLRFWQSPRGRVYAERLLTRLGITETAEGKAVRPSNLVESVINRVQAASPYFISTQILDLLTTAASTLPSCVLSLDILPSEKAWIQFEQPITLFEHRVTALCWSVFRGADQEPDHLSVYVFFDDDRGTIGVPFFACTSQWRIGERWDQDGGLDDSVRRFVAALLLFMNQTILTTNARAVTGRQARKRLAREIEEIPLVQVVALRRREHQHHSEASEMPVEWHCQWIVRGHWRQQYFPASGEHRPIWINPHVKGPDDKPLKAPRTIAYEVVR